MYSVQVLLVAMTRTSALTKAFEWNMCNWWQLSDQLCNISGKKAHTGQNRELISCHQLQVTHLELVASSCKVGVR